MDTGNKTMGQRSKWLRIIVMLVALLVASAGPSFAWGGRGLGGFHGGFHGGFRGGFHGGFHRGFHRFGGPRVAIGVGIGPWWGPYWGPYGYSYGYPYAYPPVVAPDPQLSIAPAPPTSWYYCDNPAGYYPYVQQCPGGWRPVAPTPQ